MKLPVEPFDYASLRSGQAWRHPTIPSFLYVFSHSLTLFTASFRHSRQKELDPRLRMSGTNPESLLFFSS